MKNPKRHLLELKKWGGYGVGILLALITFVFNSVLPPSVFEHLYFRGIFQVWRVFYDNSLGMLPFPVLYLLLSSALLLFIVRWNKVKPPIWKRIAGWLAWIYVLFVWLWGFNYNIPTVQARLNLKIPTLSDSTVMDELHLVVQRLNTLRSEIDSSLEINYGQLEYDIRPQLEDLLNNWDLPTYGHVRVRKVAPKGLLLRWSTAGIYLPFVSEGHIDGGLHPIQWPSTLAHEMAHGYGVTDEGECNFVALITCLEHEDQFIRYSGLILYYRYLYRTVYSNKVYRIQIIESLDSRVAEDLNDIYETLEAYPDILPAVRNWIYDLYLKNNGVKSGLKSYGQVVNLMFDYQDKYESLIR